MRAPSSPSIGWTHRIPASAISSASITGVGAHPDRPRRHGFDQHRVDLRPAVAQRLFETRRDLPARLVRDQRDTLAGLDRQAGADRVLRAGHQVGTSGAERHRPNCNSRGRRELGQAAHQDSPCFRWKTNGAVGIPVKSGAHRRTRPARAGTCREHRHRLFTWRCDQRNRERLADVTTAGRAATRGPRRDPASCVPPSYFRCLPTSFVISNMFTAALPPNTVFSGASALIMRLFLASCRPFFLM